MPTQHTANGRLLHMSTAKQRSRDGHVNCSDELVSGNVLRRFHCREKCNIFSITNVINELFRKPFCETVFILHIILFVMLLLLINEVTRKYGT